MRHGGPPALKALECRGRALKIRRTSPHMVDSTSCTQCDTLLIEIDFYGERLIGCIECNRWTRDGWLFIHLPEEDLEALRADRGPETIAEFLELQIGWTIAPRGWLVCLLQRREATRSIPNRGRSGARRIRGVGKRNGPGSPVLKPPRGN
jgi:hypothetical protein